MLQTIEDIKKQVNKVKAIVYELKEDNKQQLNKINRAIELLEKG